MLRMTSVPGNLHLIGRLEKYMAPGGQILWDPTYPISLRLFSPSVTGKKLMAKCRSLLQENAELGKQISQVDPTPHLVHLIIFLSVTAGEGGPVGGRDCSTQEV